MSLPCMFVGAPNGNSNYGGLHVYVTACMGELMARDHSMYPCACPRQLHTSRRHQRSQRVRDRSAGGTGVPKRDREVVAMWLPPIRFVFNVDMPSWTEFSKYGSVATSDDNCLVVAPNKLVVRV